jgi:hypothetical protein
MVIEVSAWYQLLLWGNLGILLMVLVSLEGIRRERKKMERVIIAMAENKRKYK